MKKNSRSYPEFTKEMKRDYTVLIPNMCSIHFEMLKNVFVNHGYRVELLTTTGRAIVDEGLKYVHNDTCYPALLCIGQFMDALHSGRYDLEKTALIMSQTGGGCRASNYIHLLRKALKADGLGHIPVISLSAQGLEKHSGFKLSLPMLRQALAALAYGDALMLLSNQCRPYEVKAGETDALVEDWIARFQALFLRGRAYQKRAMAAYLAEIVRAGLNSVDAGQTEAAKALGMKDGPILRRIILPQAMRVIVPPTGSDISASGTPLQVMPVNPSPSTIVRSVSGASPSLLIAYVQTMVSPTVSPRLPAARAPDSSTEIAGA